MWSMARSGYASSRFRGRAELGSIRAMGSIAATGSSTSKNTGADMTKSCGDLLIDGVALEFD